MLVVEVNGYTIEPGTNLRWANLDGADLSKADLSKADLSKADLTSARADENTTWPDGFDPEAAGVTFKD